MGKIIGFLVVVALLGGGGYYFMQNKSTMTEQSAAVAPTVPDAAADQAQPVAAAPTVKEFTMTAYYDEKGKWFSLKNIDVKKGDTVRIKITNTKGMHDFMLPEYNIDVDLPLNKEEVVEFVADKAGSFKYFCSMPGHRQAGQEGTLTVSE